MPVNNYDIVVLNFDEIKSSNVVGEDQFCVKFRTNVKSAEEIQDFIQDFQNKSGTTYNSYKGDKKGNGVKVIISGVRKCHHAVRRHHLKPDDTQLTRELVDSHEVNVKKEKIRSARLN